MSISSCTSNWHNEECSACGERRDKKKTLANIPMINFFGSNTLLVIYHKTKNIQDQIIVKLTSIHDGEFTFFNNTTKENLIMKAKDLRDWFVV